MTQYSVEPRTRKYVKGFLSFVRKYGKQLLNTGLDFFKKADHKTDEYLGNKVVKPKHVIDKNPRNVEEIIILPEKAQKILNKLRRVL